MPERKSWIEVVLMPVVVLLVGFVGTYFLTNQQQKSAETFGAAQLDSAKEQAAGDRQVKILEIFGDKIASTDSKERILALNLLEALDDSLALNLARAVERAETDESEVKRVAKQVFKEATDRVKSRQLVLSQKKRLEKLPDN